MRVIGTAGHVDHGKSTLVEKLSGINPDRLAEEQSRQMTIDLGFAWLDLPGGETVGVVDVPGHRDFIENMLAGVGGIDAALLVIAADEGIMPQTREHLAILRLLQVPALAVVLSKTDLVDDPEWLELVTLEVEDLLEAHGWAGAPIVPVSAQTGAGISALLAALHDLLERLPEHRDAGRPRLPVDRVFVVSGFGAVVTGTLSGGALAVGDGVELQPGGLSGRVRGLQSYQRTVERALPGSRVAVNIAGLRGGTVQRGHVLAFPGQIQPTLLVDVRFEQLEDAERPLEHNAELKLFCGAAETIARARLLDAEFVLPGESAWLQLRLRDPLPLSWGDRFILRFPSPAATIGGGSVVNPQPGRRWKRFQPAVIRELETRLNGSLAERLALAARSDAPQTLSALQAQLDISENEMAAALQEALRSGLIRQVGDATYWASVSWERLARAVKEELRDFHAANPLRLGLRRPELRSRRRVSLGLLDALLEADAGLAVERGFARLPEHRIVFSPDQGANIASLNAELAEAPYLPPTLEEMRQLVGGDVLRALMDLGRIVNVSDSIAFAAADYENLVAGIRAHIEAAGEIDAKTLRDLFGTTRKYAIPVLEHLDSLGVTRRIGDGRQAGRNFGVEA